MGGFWPQEQNLKKILSEALAALLFSGVEQYVQFWLRTLSETIL